jgi:hypothetical protein
MAASDETAQLLESNLHLLRDKVQATLQEYELAVQEADALRERVRSGSLAKTRELEVEINELAGSKVDVLYHAYRRRCAELTAACDAVRAHYPRSGEAPAPQAEGGKPAVQDLAYRLTASGARPSAASASLPARQDAESCSGARPLPPLPRRAAPCCCGTLLLLRSDPSLERRYVCRECHGITARVGAPTGHHPARCHVGGGGGDGGGGGGHDVGGAAAAQGPRRPRGSRVGSLKGRLRHSLFTCFSRWVHLHHAAVKSQLLFPSHPCLWPKNLCRAAPLRRGFRADVIPSSSPLPGFWYSFLPQRGQRAPPLNTPATS